MELATLIQLQTDFDRAHGIAKPFFVPISSNNLCELEHLVVCMVGEVGEFANELKKIVRGDSSYEERKAALAEELTDTFIYLIKIAAQTGIDLESEYLKKLEKNRQRFPTWGSP
jgi:NTP pyrophosphatase (non-canonical NTP hydrolase)